VARLALIALLATVCLAVPASAHADAFLPPGNKIFWGGQGGYTAGHIADFGRQSGKHPAVFNYFISWRNSFSNFHWLGFRLDDARRQRARTMLSVSTTDTNLKPADLA